MSQKNIVIGFYSGYDSLDTDKGGLRIFVESFRKYNKEDIIIVTLVLPIRCKELVEFCKKNNCIIENTDLSDVKTGNRWTSYKNILSSNMYRGYNINKILIMDMNDAMFQGNPFSINIYNKLYCACEKTKYIFYPNDVNFQYNNYNSMQINTNWMNICSISDNPIIFPPINPKNLIENNILNETEEKIYNKYVICSGTILGNYESIIKLLNWGCDMLGPDQGLLNIYVYLINPDECLTISLFDSEILTMDSVDFIKELKFNNEGKIINNKEQLYSICHQIDRGCHLNYFISLC
jgi:hypothetical protein